MNGKAYLRCLEPVGHPVDAVLDTDAYNEIDDQFALAYMVRSRERIHVKAIYAAPFHNARSASPADGMEKSFGEIRSVLSLMGEEELLQSVRRGSEHYLKDERTPVLSDAARDLAERAMQYTEDNPLYVVSIGAITNIASAILLEPRITDRIVIVWLGGHAHSWVNTKEFNMFQDVAAARVVFGCGAPVVQFPCMGVVSGFTVSGDDMRARLWGKNRLCSYLVENTEAEVRSYVKEGAAWSRIIWDVTAVSWLNSVENGKIRFFAYRHTPSPVCEYDFTYSFRNDRRQIAYVYYIRRDELFNDLIEKLTR